MARYIDADKFTERIKVSPAFCNINDGLLLQRVVIDLLNNAPTADVVPKSEVERLQKILDSYALQYGTVKDQQDVIDKANQELASEIFEEIEKIACVYKLDGDFYLDNGIYTELKKKYTEGEK